MKISLFCPHELIFESKNLFQTAKNRSNAQKITDNVKNLREKQGKKRFTHVNFAIFPISRFFFVMQTTFIKLTPSQRPGSESKQWDGVFAKPAITPHGTKNTLERTSEQAVQQARIHRRQDIGEIARRTVRKFLSVQACRTLIEPCRVPCNTRGTPCAIPLVRNR